MASEAELIEAIRRAGRAGDGKAVQVLGRQLEQVRARPRPKSTGRQLADATSNVAAGLAQGAASIPDTVTEAVAGGLRLAGRPITAGLSGLAEMIGADDTARAIRGGGRQWESAMAQPFTINRAVERVAPTPQSGTGRAIRFGSQVAGGAVSPVNRLIPTPKQQPRVPTVTRRPGAAAVEAGKRTNIPVMTSDVRPPRSFVGKTAQAVGERIPIAGTGGMREAQAQARVNAVREFASDLGGNSSDDAVSAVTRDMLATRGGKLTRFKAAKDSIIDSIDGAVPVGRTLAKIDDEIARLQGLRSPEVQPVIAKLQGWREALQGQNLRNIEDLRSIMGQSFDDPGLAGVKTIGQKALNRIYAPLRQDMGDFIRATGGDEPFQVWRNANKQLSGLADDLNVSNLRGVIRTGEDTPENVARLLFSNKPSDVNRLAFNLSDEGKEAAQRAILQRALEKSGGFDEVSPNRFLNQLNTMRAPVQTFLPEERVGDLQTALNVTRRAQDAAAHPTTGAQLAIPAGAAGFTSLFGSPGAGLAAAGAYGLGARGYESALVRDMLLRAARQQAQVMPPSPGLMGALMPVVSTQARTFGPALNSNVGVPLAARDREEY
jgi:hypothetical protein